MFLKEGLPRQRRSWPGIQSSPLRWLSPWCYFCDPAHEFLVRKGVVKHVICQHLRNSRCFLSSCWHTCTTRAAWKCSNISEWNLPWVSSLAAPLLDMREFLFLQWYDGCHLEVLGVYRCHRSLLIITQWIILGCKTPPNFSGAGVCGWALGVCIVHTCLFHKVMLFFGYKC